MDREYSDISAGVRRSLRTADRFDNYRQIAAKFASTGSCGHAIKKSAAAQKLDSRDTSGGLEYLVGKNLIPHA